MTELEWDQLKEIFHAAAALPLTERPAYLDQACAGDLLLRQSVESLLKSHEESAFVDAPAFAAAANLLFNGQLGEQTEAGGFQPGETIGRYRIDSILGEGGMGRVYLAEDTKLHRKVSLKFLSKAVTRDYEKLLRFEQEARAASALNHPNILTIYEFGEEDGRQFIATEYIEGQTLRERLQRTIELDDALEIVIQIASALVAAHRVNIVHRDIKPDNVIIREDDGLVKILDFGLAKILTPRTLRAADVNGEATTRFKTGPGVVMGTVAYMSPEQARGDKIDERTDIWSLGVVLYEMITGSTPFAAETSNEIISGILSRQPAPPLARFSHDVPERLQEIVEKTLTKERGERYQTSKDLLIDLRRLKQSLELKASLDRSSDPDSASAGIKSAETVGERPAVPTAYPTSSAEYIFNQVKSHNRVVITVIALIAILAIGVVGVGISIYKSRQQQSAAVGLPAIKSIAVLPFVNGNTDADTEFLADGLTDNLIDRLSQISGLRVMSHTAVFHYKGGETDPRTIGSELGVEAVLSGRLTKRNDLLAITLELVNAKDNSHIWGEQYNRKLSELLALQRDIPSDVSDKLRLKLSGESKARLTHAYTENTDAYELYLKGRHAWETWTLEGAKQAVPLFEEAIRKDPNYALAYSGLADVYLWGRFAGAGLPQKEAHRRGREAANKALSLDPELGEAHASLSLVLLYDDWDFAGAERELKRALELNPGYGEGHHQYSHLLLLLGRLAESLAESQKFLDLDPVSESPIGHLCYNYLAARRYDDAIAQCRKDVQLYPDSSQHYSLAAAYEHKGMLREAFEENLIGMAHDGTPPDEIAEYRKVFSESGMAGAYRHWLESFRSKYHDQSPAYIAELYARLGEKDKAFEWLEKAYAAHDDGLVRLKENLAYDSLRSDPRYTDLLRRVGLPQ